MEVRYGGQNEQNLDAFASLKDNENKQSSLYASTTLRHFVTMLMMLRGCRGN